VAEAVAGYRAGVEERLRTAERERAAAKAAEQRRRRRAQLGLAAAVLAIVTGGGLFAWWQDRQAVALTKERQFKERQARDGIDAALKLSVALRRQYRFREAEDALNQAAQLTDWAPDLVPRVEQAKADLAFVRRLDDIRMKQSTVTTDSDGKQRLDMTGALKDYPEAFRDRGLDVLGGNPDEVAAAVAGSTVRAELIAALEDWAALAEDDATRGHVLGVLRRADPGPWLDVVRDPAIRRNRMTLGLLARLADTARLHPATIIALASVMARRGLDPAGLLLRAQFARPGEFLISFELGGWYYLREIHGDAIAHYRAARVTRPKNVAVLVNLGSALDRSGEPDGAEEAYREAIRLDPKSAKAHHNLGVIQHKKADLDGAIGCYREAARLEPGNAETHFNLGVALNDQGNPARAEPAFREAIRLDPNHVKAHLGLGSALYKKGNLAGAEAAYRDATRLDPGNAEAHYGLGMVLAARDDVAGAEAAYREAIRLDPKFAVAHNGLGTILCDVKREYDAAADCFREAIRLDPKKPQYTQNLNLALKLKAVRDAKTAPPPRPVDR
jgi:tetratricopeptide (TPR) repeat protein